jgi:hypothetical protein
MKQILVELDIETAEALERVAPARSRRRSEFIRAAVRSALWDLEERRTAEAYAKHPDTEPEFFDPASWERTPAKAALRSTKSPPPAKAKTRQRRRSKTT